MDNLRYRLVLASYLKGSAKHKLEAAHSLSESELESALGKECLEEAQKEAMWEERGAGRHVFYGDPDWPVSLTHEKYSPFFLEVVGSVENICKRMSVGIVGTRCPTGLGVSSAVALAADATLDGALTVSGFARGIDYSSAWGSVFAEGPTLQVLPCGLGDSYSKRRLAFQDRILEFGGALISPFHLFDTAQAFRFYERNHVIALLCDVVVAVEAPVHSGTLITVGYALEAGREVLVHYCGSLPGKERLGTIRLVSEGAPVIKSWDELKTQTGLSRSKNKRLCMVDTCSQSEIQLKSDVFAGRRYAIVDSLS